jgi:hypothetical protein
LVDALDSVPIVVLQLSIVHFLSAQHILFLGKRKTRRERSILSNAVSKKEKRKRKKDEP